MGVLPYGLEGTGAEGPDPMGHGLASEKMLPVLTSSTATPVAGLALHLDAAGLEAKVGGSEHDASTREVVADMEVERWGERCEVVLRGISCITDAWEMEVGPDVVVFMGNK